MWETTVDGRVLHFHLAGINNQNFIMRDEETGSWWQQVTGEAIFGPLKGKRLKPVFLDELTFGTWKREQPQARTARPRLRCLDDDRSLYRDDVRLLVTGGAGFIGSHFVKQGASPLRLVDAETGSEWDFTGKAIGGTLDGKQLKKIPVLNDYWFDWKTYHPETKIYQLGNR